MYRKQAHDTISPAFCLDVWELLVRKISEDIASDIMPNLRHKTHEISLDIESTTLPSYN